MILIGIVITSVLYWATTNVCRYNFVIKKKTNEMNIIAAEIKPEIKLGKVYYFKELKVENSFTNIQIIRVLQNKIIWNNKFMKSKNEESFYKFISSKI